MYSILGNYKALPNWYKNVSFVTQELDIKVKLIQLKVFVGEGNRSQTMRKAHNKQTHAHSTRRIVVSKQ